MDEETPVCPGCAAVAQLVCHPILGQRTWETVHEDDCPWMHDPDSEAY